MQNMIETAEIGPDGTVKLPEDARKRAGFKEGSAIIVLSSERGVMLGKANKKFLEATSRLHARKKKISEDEVEDFVEKARYGDAS